MHFYGGTYRLTRTILRWFCPTYHIDHVERLKDPSVYLCRHFNTRGVFMTVPWLPGRIRTWSLHIYHDHKACFTHMMDYTLTARFGWPRWKAWLASVPISRYLQALMRSGKAIPVYRGTMQTLRTYQISLEALKNGDSILIFPDRSYTSQETEMGDMYEGFLMVDRLFFRETGHHIPFVTLYADPATRTIHAGEPIIFQGDLRDREERRRVTDLIRRQLSGEMQAQPAAEAAVQAPR